MAINYTYIFWFGTILFLITAITMITNIAPAYIKTAFYIQTLAGTMMFVGSKIGRAFLGLE